MQFAIWAIDGFRTLCSKTLTRRALPEILPDWGILVLESHHASDFFMEWRTHDFIKVIYALQGTGSLLLGKKTYEFHAQDVLLVPAGVANRIVDSPEGPTSLYVLCVDTSLLAFDRAIEQQLEAGRFPRSEYFAKRVEASLRRLLFRQSHSGKLASLAMAAAVLELFQSLLATKIPRRSGEKSGSHAVEDMTRYVEHLDSHFFEAQDIAAAAKQLGLSRRTFTKRFREVTGTTWLKYVRSKAIDHACRLLLETSAPITSIAFECGFADLSTFYRQFKSHMGVTPAAWRAGSGVSRAQDWGTQRHRQLST